MEYLHSLGIPHGDLRGVGASGCSSTFSVWVFFLSLVPGYVFILILFQQANVVVDQRGRARLTEYGLAPINHDPRLTYAAVSGTLVASRWLAPEIMDPSHKGNMLAIESKVADVFAFGMFGAEIFTGKVPFEEQRNEAVVLHILRGGRPEMPENAQAVGLTGEMWKLLERCWQQNPNKRPAITEVVRDWQRFVGSDGCSGGTIECVQSILVIRTTRPHLLFRFQFLLLI